RRRDPRRIGPSHRYGALRAAGIGPLRGSAVADPARSDPRGGCACRLAPSPLVRATAAEGGISGAATGAAVLAQLYASRQDASARRYALALAGQRFEVFFSN